MGTGMRLQHGEVWGPEGDKTHLPVPPPVLSCLSFGSRKGLDVGEAGDAPAHLRLEGCSWAQVTLGGSSCSGLCDGQTVTAAAPRVHSRGSLSPRGLQSEHRDMGQRRAPCPTFPGCSHSVRAPDLG